MRRSVKGKEETGQLKLQCHLVINNMN